MARPAEGEDFLASYDRSDRAVEAVRALEADGVDTRDIRVGDPHDQRHMLKRQQRAEMEAAVPMIGAGMFTPGQAWGAFSWGLLGMIVGAAIVGPFGLVFQIGSWSTWVSVAVLAFIGALFLGSAGFVYGGGRKPELNGEVRANDADVTVGVQPRDADQRTRAGRVLQHTQARDIEQHEA